MESRTLRKATAALALAIVALVVGVPAGATLALDPPSQGQDDGVSSPGSHCGPEKDGQSEATAGAKEVNSLTPTASHFGTQIDPGG